MPWHTGTQAYGSKALQQFAFEWISALIRNGQISKAAALLGQSDFAIMLSKIIADSIKGLGTDAKVLFKGGKLPVYDHETPLPFTVWNNTMMYGEVRRGISEHTTCAVIPQAVRLSANEYDVLVLPDSDSLSAPEV